MDQLFEAEIYISRTRRSSWYAFLLLSLLENLLQLR
ncbi:hypothetical protein LINPERHAP2_LOCUS16926 [Linum perenne]